MISHPLTHEWANPTAPNKKIFEGELQIVSEIPFKILDSLHYDNQLKIVVVQQPGNANAVFGYCVINK